MLDTCPRPARHRQIGLVVSRGRLALHFVHSNFRTSVGLCVYHSSLHVAHGASTAILAEDSAIFLVVFASFVARTATVSLRFPLRAFPDCRDIPHPEPSQVWTPPSCGTLAWSVHQTRPAKGFEARQGRGYHSIPYNYSFLRLSSHTSSNHGLMR